MRAATVTLATLFALPCAAMALDLDLYQALLQRYTRETNDLAGVRVDYPGLRDDGRWQDLLSSLASSDPSEHESPKQQLAFWSNAYNILAIDMVVRHAPRESITDIGSFFSPVWKKSAGSVAGRPYSLDAIEHEIVRPMGDPRAHVALICASLSCPPLLREPWRGERLDAQLDAQLRVWLAHPEKGMRLDREARTLYLSRVFKWFEGDFDARGGVRAFVTPYAREDDARWLREHAAELRIRHLDYDWGLNALGR